MSQDLKPLLWIAAIIIAFLIFANQGQAKEIKALRNTVDQHKEINLHIRRRLKGIIDSETDIDPEISQELMNIYALLEINQDTKALLALAKIIENLLRELYSSDDEFRNTHPQPSFSDYLDHARRNNIIS